MKPGSHAPLWRILRPPGLKTQGLIKSVIRAVEAVVPSFLQGCFNQPSIQSASLARSAAPPLWDGRGATGAQRRAYPSRADSADHGGVRPTLVQVQSRHGNNVAADEGNAAGDQETRYTVKVDKWATLQQRFCCVS